MKKTNLIVAASAASAVVVSGAASAAGEGAAAIAAVATEAAGLADAAWPVAIAIVGSLVGIKLFKKYANKAS